MLSTNFLQIYLEHYLINTRCNFQVSSPYSFGDYSNKLLVRKIKIKKKILGKTIVILCKHSITNYFDSFIRSTSLRSRIQRRSLILLLRQNLRRYMNFAIVLLRFHNKSFFSLFLSQVYHLDQEARQKHNTARK